MAFNRKNWQDNVSDITAAELNRIEQGIYDNSLVVDAITNKLNPTDTETYKTAELTEGQITDVIGVSDIVIKGDTEQDGTPTPSAPVDINVVSGSNVINTSNKNLLSLPNGTYSYNNATAIVNKGIITINGTPSSTPTLLRISLTQPIKLKQNDSIKINGNNSNGIGTNSNYVAFRLAGTVNGVSNDNITDILCTNANANKTFTATNDTIINQAIIRGNTNVTFNNFVIKPQLEKGSTATTYEPHQGKELPLDLPVENLFDKDDTSKILNAFINATDKKITTSNGTKSLYVPIKPNTEYVISKILSARFLVGTFENYEIGTISSQPIITYNTRTSGTIISGANDRYLGVFYYLSSADTLTEEEIRNSIQVEEGSKANAYTPYGTDPIELCKIGDYQDYFYKSGSKWYLHKEISSSLFDGSETWTYSSSNTVFYTDALTLSQTSSNLFCNRFSKVANTTTYANMNTGEIKYDGTGSKRIIIKYTDITSVADFKTWLASNNIKVYYPLETATDTEITDTTLISQLEAIYNAPLYEETNITQENNDLPMVLDITACKDNINGIKAFIRK